MKNCNTREEVIEKVLNGGSNLEASKRLLELGYTNDAFSLYLLSQQEIFLEGFNQQMAVAEEIANTNKTAGCFMIEASQKNQDVAQLMVQTAEEIINGSNRIVNAAENFRESSNRMTSVVEVFAESASKFYSASMNRY